MSSDSEPEVEVKDATKTFTSVGDLLSQMGVGSGGSCSFGGSTRGGKVGAGSRPIRRGLRTKDVRQTRSSKEGPPKEDPFINVNTQIQDLRSDIQGLGMLLRDVHKLVRNTYEANLNARVKRTQEI